MFLQWATLQWVNKLKLYVSMWINLDMMLSAKASCIMMYSG